MTAATPRQFAPPPLPSSSISRSHGNGNGPHNIALHAGLSNGGVVEYHFHKWMAYNAIFKSVPQPEDGYLRVSQEPGLGLSRRMA